MTVPFECRCSGAGRTEPNRAVAATAGKVANPTDQAPADQPGPADHVARSMLLQRTAQDLIVRGAVSRSERLEQVGEAATAGYGCVRAKPEANGPGRRAQAVFLCEPSQSG